MKAAMIINPHAGRKKGLAIAESSLSRFEEAGIEVTQFISRKPGDTERLAEQLDTSSYEAVLAVGGDGTLFEVINGLLKKSGSLDIPIGQIPVGTGNSFIKDLHLDEADGAIEAIIGGETREIDLGYFTSEGKSHYFINLLGAGFVSNVAYRANRYKAFGSFSYIFGVLEEVAVLKATRLTMTIDGHTYEREAQFVEICNSRYTGGDMMMAPDAKIDDGLLDIILMKKSTRRKLLSLFPSIFKGLHVDDDVIEVFRGKEIKLKTESPLALTPDGETFGSTPLDVKILPGKIRMFC